MWLILLQTNCTLQAQNRYHVWERWRLHLEDIRSIQGTLEEGGLCQIGPLGPIMIRRPREKSLDKKDIMGEWETMCNLRRSCLMSDTMSPRTVAHAPIPRTSMTNGLTRMLERWLELEPDMEILFNSFWPSQSTSSCAILDRCCCGVSSRTMR